MSVRSRGLRCPKCAHEFRRIIGHMKGRTTCPVCRHEALRTLFLPAPAESKAIICRDLAERRRRNHEKSRAKLEGKLNQSGVIRGAQIPNSPSEAAFKAEAIARGFKAHRPSWPDFLLETADGSLVAVEVKARKEAIAASQRLTFDLLEKYGIPVFIWRNGSGIARWNRYRSNLSRSGTHGIDEWTSLAGLQPQSSPESRAMLSTDRWGGAVIAARTAPHEEGCS
jgi:hypothetical protein